jgi:hypothetical protein
MFVLFSTERFRLLYTVKPNDVLEIIAVYSQCDEEPLQTRLLNFNVSGTYSNHWE